mmetsp:Transcript_87533/g.137077  ORF Transcript_87533/g.137077 Transcript_87533/m.137077 type:complete len:266 (-) Transcript_87533:873-1670(-)
MVFSTFGVTSSSSSSVSCFSSSPASESSCSSSPWSFRSGFNSKSSAKSFSKSFLSKSRACSWVLSAGVLAFSLGALVVESSSSAASSSESSSASSSLSSAFSTSPFPSFLADLAFPFLAASAVTQNGLLITASSFLPTLSTLFNEMAKSGSDLSKSVFASWSASGNMFSSPGTSRRPSFFAHDLISWIWVVTFLDNAIRSWHLVAIEVGLLASANGASPGCVKSKSSLLTTSDPTARICSEAFVDERQCRRAKQCNPRGNLSRHC